MGRESTRWRPVQRRPGSWFGTATPRLPPRSRSSGARVQPVETVRKPAPSPTPRGDQAIGRGDLDPGQSARRGAEPGTRRGTGDAARGRGPESSRNIGCTLSRSDAGASSVETRRKPWLAAFRSVDLATDRLSRFLPPAGSRPRAPADPAFAAGCLVGRGGGNETPAPGVGGRFDGTGGRLGRRCSTMCSDQAVFLRLASVCRLETAASLPFVMWLASGQSPRGSRGFCIRAS